MKRHIHIDTLRGISMLMIILTHTTSYFLKDSLANFLWNASQFSVTVFIFCSFYLFFKNPPIRTFPYLKKRFLRLFIPYIIFLLFFIPLQFLHDPRSMTMHTAMQYFTLTTAGNDLSWLVLLFIQLSFVGIIIQKIHKNKLLFHLFLVSCFLSTLFLLAPRSLGGVGISNFKLVMWLPWSLIIFFTYFFTNHEKSKTFLKKMLLATGWIFLILNAVQIAYLYHPLLYDNKYPPNLYHLSYGIFWTCLLILLERQGIFNYSPLRSLLHFLSKYSYPIFFIHFLLLYMIVQFQPVLLGNLHWWGFFGVLLFGSLGIQSGIMFASRRLVFPERNIHK